MRGDPITDREAYPAAWITLAALAAAFLIWFALGEPTVSRCWVWEHWHVYCPGCGGTRALIALAHAQLGAALRYHPPVVITLALAGAYLLTQTVWRLRGRRGWVLHYRLWWPAAIVGLFLVNCLARNILLLGVGIAM